MGPEVENYLPPFRGEWGLKHRSLSLDQKGADPFYFSTPEERLNPGREGGALRSIFESVENLLV